MRYTIIDSQTSKKYGILRTNALLRAGDQITINEQIGESSCWTITVDRAIIDTAKTRDAETREQILRITGEVNLFCKIPEQLLLKKFGGRKET
jgi:hypothetical protein